MTIERLTGNGNNIFVVIPICIAMGFSLWELLQSYLCSFVQQILMDSWQVPNTILDLQDTVIKKTNKVTALKELESSWKASLLNVLGLLLGSDIEPVFFFLKNGKDPAIMDLVQEHSRS